MVELKTDTSIDAMYEAGQVVARALTAVREAADVGVSLLELNEIAHDVLREAGATSPSWATGPPSRRPRSRPCSAPP